MAGQPTKITPDVVRLLEQSLQNGFTISKACELAKISREAYYQRINTDSQFLDKMTTAQAFAEEVARQNVVTAIVKDKDVATSRWYLERKARAEFSTRTEVGGGGEPLNIALIEFVGKDDTDPQQNKG